MRASNLESLTLFILEDSIFIEKQNGQHKRVTQCGLIMYFEIHKRLSSCLVSWKINKREPSISMLCVISLPYWLGFDEKTFLLYLGYQSKLPFMIS